jgi:integrase
VRDDEKHSSRCLQVWSRSRSSIRWRRPGEGDVAAHLSRINGLRPVELVTLRWDAIDFAHGQIHVSRAKNGSPSVHPLSGVELRALRRLKRDQEPPSPFVFTSERGAPFTTAGWRKMVARLGVAAKLGFKAHPHMFRHACGFQLANQGTDTRTLQAYLGHRNIQHTVRYTELSPTRFKNLWRD